MSTSEITATMDWGLLVGGLLILGCLAAVGAAASALHWADNKCQSWAQSHPCRDKRDER